MTDRNTCSADINPEYHFTLKHIHCSFFHKNLHGYSALGLVKVTVNLK